MLSKRFKPEKCKTSLKLAVARMKLLKNKRVAQLKLMKRELSQLLESGQEKTAMIRVEHVLREEKTMAAYDIIELYCELIATRLSIIESQKNCPIDLKESISSVIFASPRCADIPELLIIQKHFTAKYGKEFVTAALELRPDCGVNRTIIEKLSAKTPDGQTKIKILTAIAEEHNVKWDPNALEEQFLNPPEDLLNGPRKFVSASTMNVESLNAHFQPAANQSHDASRTSVENDVARYSAPNIHFQPPANRNHEPSRTSVENDAARSSASSTPFSSMDRSTASVPANHTNQRTSEGRVGGDYRHSFSRDVLASHKQSWNMEFKDATSAAQAAAESAERASIAARAAAELSRGNFRGAYTSESHGPLKVQHSEDLLKMEPDLWSSSDGMQPRMPNGQRDEMENFHHLRAAESRYDSHGSVERRPSKSSVTPSQEEAMANLQRAAEFSQIHSPPIETMNDNWHNTEKGEFHRDVNDMKQPLQSAPSRSTIDSIDDDISVVSIQQEDGFSDKGFSGAESANWNQQSNRTEKGGPLGMGSFQKEPEKSTSFTYNTRSTSDDATWITNIHGFEDDTGLSSVSMERGNTQIGSKQPGFSDFPAAVFDDSGSDGEDDLDLSNMDPWSPKHRGGSLTKDSFSTQQNFVSERHSAALFSEGTVKKTAASQSDDLLHPTFDDSDDAASENEEADNLKPRERMSSQSADLLRPTFSGSDAAGSENEEGDSFKPRERMAQSSHGRADSSMYKKTVAEEANWETQFHSSDDLDSVEAHFVINQNKELNTPAHSRKMHGTSDSFNHQLSPRQAISLQKSDDSAREPFYSPMAGEKQPVQLSKFPSSKEQAHENFGLPSLSTSNQDLELSNNLSSESSNEFLYGRRLRGGFRNKGYTQPPYVKGRSGDDSLQSKPSAADVMDTVIENPADFSSFEKTVNSKARNSKQHNQKPLPNIRKESTSSRRPFFDSDSDEAEEVQTRQPVGNSSHRAGIVSRRSRDSTSQLEKGTPLRFTPKSEVPTRSDFGSGSRFSPSLPDSPISEPSSRPQIHTPGPSASFEKASKQLPQTEISVHKENVKSAQLSSVVEQPSKHVPRTADSTKPSTSRESSLKSASHVHPKLPDYDSLAAHFESLRSDQRKQ